MRIHWRGRTGEASYLTKDQERQVVVATGGGTAAVRDWIEAQFGVACTCGSLYRLLPRLGTRLQMPRPRHAQTDPQAQAA